MAVSFPIRSLIVDQPRLSIIGATGGGGGGSSIVKVPGDVPPTRVYFFGLLRSLAKGMLFGNFSQV